MTRLTTSQIQADPAAFLASIAAGESVVISEDDQPIAEVKPISNVVKKKRVFGLAEGEFVVPDDFDAPLPEDILDLFEGK